MIYGSDDRHAELRQKAVEEILNHPEDYSESIDAKTTLSQYAERMKRLGNGVDDTIIRASATALQVEIRFVKALSDKAERITPSKVTRSIIIGQTDEYNFFATKNKDEE